MEDNAAPLRPDALHAQRDWVRRVARALVADPNAAEDLEQEVWVKALEKRPVVRRSLRAWLGAVLRNAAVDRHRGERRRAVHEQAAAPAETAVPSPLDLVARAEALQRVGAAVLALREPYRTTLLLRYFEDLSPAEIARRLDIPRETVRTRLHRGLAELRDALDVGPEGERRAWLLVLALPAGARGAAAPIPAGYGGESGAWSGGDRAARAAWESFREVTVMGARATFTAGLATGGVAGVLLVLVPGVLAPEPPPAPAAPAIHAAAEDPGDTPNYEITRPADERRGANPPRDPGARLVEAATQGSDDKKSAALLALLQKNQGAAREALRKQSPVKLLEVQGAATTAELMESLKAIARTPQWQRKEAPDVAGGMKLVEELLAMNLEPEQRARVLVNKAILHRMQDPPDPVLEEAALREAATHQSMETETGREVVLQQAWTTARNGDDRAAAELFDKVATHPSTDPGVKATSRWESALRADRLGEREDARRRYEEFVRDYENERNPWHQRCVAEAKRRLKEL